MKVNNAEHHSAMGEEKCKLILHYAGTVINSAGWETTDDGELIINIFWNGNPNLKSELNIDRRTLTFPQNGWDSGFSQSYAQDFVERILCRLVDIENINVYFDAAEMTR